MQIREELVLNPPGVFRPFGKRIKHEPGRIHGAARKVRLHVHLAHIHLHGGYSGCLHPCGQCDLPGSWRLHVHKSIQVNFRCSAAICTLADLQWSAS